MESDDRFLTFARLVRETNYDRDLSEEGPLTIAPTDDAFDTLNTERPGYMTSLDAIGKEMLVASHLVESKVLLGASKSKWPLEFQGTNLPITDENATVSVAGSPISEADIGADIEGLNGVIHSVRRVILRERNPTLRELLFADGRFTV